MRADSPLNFVHEIRDSKINVGPLRQRHRDDRPRRSTADVRTTVPATNAQFLSNEDALVKLTVDKSIDVAIIVAGQPAKLLVDMKPEARKLSSC